MDVNNLLGLTWSQAENILNEQGYEISRISYLNEPSGIIRLVRIREGDSKKVEVLLSFIKNNEHPNN